jgi:hypothetical protein
MPNNGIWNIPWSISYQMQGFRLKVFQKFNIGSGCSAPYLDAVGPDGFDGNFIDE